MEKLFDIARNSPLTKKRMGGYEVREAEQKDPFVEGICFYAHHVGSYEAASKFDSPDVQSSVQSAWNTVEQSGIPLKKVVITVRATNIIVKERGAKNSSEYPIYFVSYCGSSTAIDNLFFFIHKVGRTTLFIVQLFKLESREKVTAVTLTVAKAFNIAYKAYMLERRKRERMTGSESPRVQRKQLGGTSSPKTSRLLKSISPGTASGLTSGASTPPVVRKVSNEEQRERAGSLGEQSKPAPPPSAGSNKPPPTTFASSAPHITLSSEGVGGSTHDVTITEDFYKEFHDLTLESTSSEIELGTHLPAKSSSFSLDAIKQYTDPVSDVDFTNTATETK